MSPTLFNNLRKISQNKSRNSEEFKLNLFEFNFEFGKNFDYYFPQNNIKNVLGKIKSNLLSLKRKNRKKSRDKCF